MKLSPDPKSLGNRLSNRGYGFSRAVNRCALAALEAAEKLAAMKGMAFRPYKTVV
jgi:hypothetical protein